jgi:hypothetical protein
MATLRIYNYDGGVLAVDLRHLFDLLVPRSLQATWTVSPVEGEEFFATGQGGDQLDALARNRSPVSGAILAELAKATVQVIGGSSWPSSLNRASSGLQFEQSIAPSTK